MERNNTKTDSTEGEKNLIRGIKEEILQNLTYWIYYIDWEPMKQFAIIHQQLKGWELGLVKTLHNGELIHQLAAFNAHCIPITVGMFRILEKLRSAFLQKINVSMSWLNKHIWISQIVIGKNL